MSSQIISTLAYQRLSLVSIIDPYRGLTGKWHLLNNWIFTNTCQHYHKSTLIVKQNSILKYSIFIFLKTVLTPVTFCQCSYKAFECLSRKNDSGVLFMISRDVRIGYIKIFNTRFKTSIRPTGSHTRRKGCFCSKLVKAWQQVFDVTCSPRALMWKLQVTCCTQNKLRYFPLCVSYKWLMVLDRTYST